MAELTVREVMITEVVTVSPDTTVRELAELLAGRDISGAPVVDGEGKLVGVVSEADVVQQDRELHFPYYIPFLDSIIYLEWVPTYEKRFRKMFGVVVGDIMTKRVITVSPEDSIHHAATLMSDKRVNRLPVVEAGKLVGILTRADIVRAIAQHEA